MADKTYVIKGIRGLMYQVRRKLFIQLMPKELTIFAFEGMLDGTCPGTGLYDADTHIGWGSAKVRVHQDKSVSYSAPSVAPREGPAAQSGDVGARVLQRSSISPLYRLRRWLFKRLKPEYLTARVHADYDPERLSYPAAELFDPDTDTQWGWVCEWMYVPKIVDNALIYEHYPPEKQK